ncbi:MAG: hypothetical protein C0518_09260 [Opitutus sp.]|nr:hypothetical protein [Opitutus sp.]
MNEFRIMRSGNALALAGATAVFLVTALWLRTGWVPSPSGGDEVWWSEAGYQWLQDGVLRWACLDDERGSAVLSFWPPLSPLLQAGAMHVFGVTAFGVSMQSSLVATLLLLVVFRHGQLLGFTHARAIFAAIALFGLLIVERRLLQVRMENLTALCAALFFALLFSALRGRLFLAGCATGLGVMAYYPQAPFLLLASTVAVWASGQRSARALLEFGAGGVMVAALAAMWIAPHWELFREQVLHTGSDRYFSASNVLRPFTALLPPASLVDRVQQTEKWLVLAVGALALWLERGAARRALGWFALIGSAPMFCYDPSPQVFPAVAAVVLLFGWTTRWPMLAQTGLVLLAVAKMSLTLFTAWHQREGRDYGPVARDLLAAVDPQARFAVSQEAWLALRPHVAADNLHLLVVGYTTAHQRPRVAYSPRVAEELDYLVLRRDRIEETANNYPPLGAALRDGQFVLKQIVQPPLAPLPWSRVPTYQLAIYVRAGLAAQ